MRSQKADLILTSALALLTAATSLAFARDDAPATKSSGDSPKTAAPAEGTDTPKEGEKPKDESKDAEKEKKAKKNPIEVATFGGGCFWSIEAIFERVPGVLSVVSGFSGGSVPYPSYQMVCTGTTGHAEVVQITFDSRKVEYETLLKLFWKAHDPTTPNAQGDDHGPQYRSIIFYHSDDQKESAWKVYKELKTKRVYRAPIVTQLYKFQAFYPAEPYHQDYFRNNPASTYSQIYIVPKIWKLKLK